MPRTIIYDNDAATDDAIALAYLAYHPNIKIAAITIAGTGEAHGEFGAQNMADLSALFGLNNIPIAYGRGQPIDSHGTPFPEFLRQSMDQLIAGKGVPKQHTTTIEHNAVELMKRTIEASDTPITILATGPLTNVAQLIQHYPTLANKIDNIVIMGGAVAVSGNIKNLEHDTSNQVAEWNIYADPKAADIVFQSGIPVTLVPLDATTQVPMTKQFYDNLSMAKQPQLQIIYKLLGAIIDEFGMDHFINHFYLWDALAAMVCAEPTTAIIEKKSLRMDIELAWTKSVDATEEGAAMIDVATQIPNAHTVLGRFIDAIKRGIADKQTVHTESMFAIQPSTSAVNVAITNHPPQL